MKLEKLQHILGLLRAAHWAHWTSHWQVQGEPFYGDHLMLSRMYEAIEEEIDTLAEKIVGEFGAQAVDPVEQMHLAMQVLAEHENADPVVRSLSIEDYIQAELDVTYRQLKQGNMLSLGLDDFIMSIANAHETHLYLLRQKLRAASRRVSDGPV